MLSSVDWPAHMAAGGTQHRHCLYRTVPAGNRLTKPTCGTPLVPVCHKEIYDRGFRKPPVCSLAAAVGEMKTLAPSMPALCQQSDIESEGTMGFSYRIFGVEIERQVRLDRVSWPKPGEAEQEQAFGFLIGNYSYCDLQGIGWDHALRVADLERQCIESIEGLSGPGQIEVSSVADVAMDYLDWDLEHIMDGFGSIAMLDVGVAATVAALSAWGHIPFTSCNAGAFGGWHPEDHPLVVFSPHLETFPFVMECAERSVVGLKNAGGAYNPVMVYADDVRKFRVFADALFEQAQNSRSSERER